MSIETLLTRVAEALESNTEAMHALMKDSAGASKPASKPAAEKTAAKPAAKPAANKTTTKKGATTVEDVTEKVTAYLKTGSKAEREEHKEHVKAILDHYAADRFTNIDSENFDEALGFLEQFAAGEDPFDGGGADEDDDAMV